MIKIKILLLPLLFITNISYSQNINHSFNDSISQEMIYYNKKMNEFDDDITAGSSLLVASGVCLAINLIGNISGVQENGLYISMNISSVVFLITGGSLIAIGAKNKKKMRQKYYKL